MSSLAKMSEKFAKAYSVEASEVAQVLKATVFKVKEGKEITDEQMVALLIVCDQYGLNPLTKEIYAFVDYKNGGGVVPFMSVDGWLKIINRHAEYNGMEFRWSEEITTISGSKDCPKWCECVIYKKTIDRPIIIREYLDECYVPPRGTSVGPWQSHTKRMLRHKAIIQTARVAFGFSGVYDQDEAEAIVSEKDMGVLERTDTKREQDEPLALPDYSQEKLEQNLKSWKDLIASGKNTAEQIIASVSSSFTLSEEQIKVIKHLK